MNCWPVRSTASCQVLAGGVSTAKYGGRRVGPAPPRGRNERTSDKNKLSRKRTVPLSRGGGELPGAPLGVCSFKSRSPRTSKPVWRTNGRFSPRKVRSNRGCSAAADELVAPTCDE